MKNYLFAVTLLIIFSQFLNAQQNSRGFENLGTGIGQENCFIQNTEAYNYKLPSEANGEDTFLKTIFILSPLNPMLIVENKNVYFALTKELTVAFPFVRTGKWGSLLRIGAEYSYVFRSENNSHIRAFACVDLPIEAGDFAAIMISPGAGYFTDTKKNGIFPQLSAGILAPFSNSFAANLYIKARYNFMLKKEESDVFDTSLGIGITIYPF